MDGNKRLLRATEELLKLASELPDDASLRIEQAWSEGNKVMFIKLLRDNGIELYDD